MTVCSIVLFAGLFSLTLRNNSILPVFSKHNTQPVVVIDPGHGGFDGGAVGTTGVNEKGINLEISQKLSYLLGFYGVDTRMTRNDDVSIHSGEAESIRQKKATDIRNRVKMVNETPDATLISVHLNWFSQASCRGAQVFYSKNNPDGKLLAEVTQKSLAAGLDPQNHRIAKAGEDHIYLLKNVACPAILVECGFLTNPVEEQKLVNDDYQKKIAVCVAASYIQYWANSK